jgi:hypothetical protein
MQNSEHQHLQIEELKAIQNENVTSVTLRVIFPNYQYTVLSVPLQLFSNAYPTLKSSKRSTKLDLHLMMDANVPTIRW